MNKKKIIGIWDRLAKVDSNGLSKLLYSPEFSQFVYCTISKPKGDVGIGISYSDTIKVNIKGLVKLRDVDVYVTTDTSYNGNNMLVLQLNNDKYIEIFSVLCDNLIQSISNISDSNKAINIVVNLLEKWKTLFSKLNEEGLSLQEQQGLFGEMYLLKKLFAAHNDNSEILNMWVGVDKELRDFQRGECAIEVKTASSNNHQRLTISSERQLDESLLKDLYLFHLSVETSMKNGETLNQMVTDIREYLEADFKALNLFNTKLMVAGYFNTHAELYDNRSYKVRQEQSYKVTDNFPRIKESDLMGGVGDVKYSIIIDMCSEHFVSDAEIFKSFELCKN